MKEVTNLDVLGLPNRILNPLRRAGIHSVETLAAMSKADLLKLRCIGKKSVQDIEIALKGYDQSQVKVDPALDLPSTPQEFVSWMEKHGKLNLTMVEWRTDGPVAETFCCIPIGEWEDLKAKLT